MALTEQQRTVPASQGSKISASEEPRERPPQLAEGVELIGEYEGSGFKEPPSIVRRMDDQIIQLPPLLYRVLANVDGRRGYDEIAARVSDEVQRGLDGGQVRFLAEEKLRPLGLLAAADGTSPQLEKPDPFLALRFRAAIIPESMSERVGGVFAPLFLPVAVVAVLATFVAVDVWVFAFHGVAQALRQSIYHPGLFLPLFLAVVLTAAFHEIGHAAACRYGGGHPGRMGCGIYLAWPAFYTDVTDAYRLGRRARLRTDLGGVYFNVVVVLVTAGLYFATGFEPLLLLIVIQHFEIAHQLLPVVRLDGYYIVSDLTGVPDLFARIGPILRSALPWRRPDEQVTALKRWVRVAVTAWVFIVVPLLLFEMVVVLIHLPRIIGTAWDSGRVLLDATGTAFGSGQVISGIASILQLVVLVIPIAGILLMLWKAGAGAGRWTWTHTDGRPVLRTAAVAGGLLLAAALAASWLPGGNYQPIQPGERGTLADGARAVTRLPKGDAPRADERSTLTTTDTGTTANSPSQAGDPASTAPTASSGSTASTASNASTPTTAVAPGATEPTTTAPHGSTTVTTLPPTTQPASSASASASSSSSSSAGP